MVGHPEAVTCENAQSGRRFRVLDKGLLKVSKKAGRSTRARGSRSA